ncbi:MAG: glycosyltransferase family 4 protein [bacterium]|nr:glycosyltransferase family 4 protein [bacterium]
MNAHPRKKVAVITKYFHPVVAGIENNIMQTYTTLQKDFGWDVTIHTSKDTYVKKDCLSPEETINTLTVKRYQTGMFGFNPEIDWKNIDVIALHNFDIFFVRYLVKALYLKLMGKKTFALIVTPHGGFSPEWSMFPPFSRFIKKIYTYTLGAWLINATVDGVRAVSGWERSEEIKFIKNDKVHLIDNGLEDEAYTDIEKLASGKIKKDVQAYGRYVIQIARVYPIKNFETAIKSLAYVPEDIKFVIVGQLQDEEYQHSLALLIKRLHLENRVIFAGVVRGVDKYYLMRHAIAMVHMALWESGCNVVREGMSQGLPCIVSNVYGLPGLVKDEINGFCLSVHNEKNVAERITWILDKKNSSTVQKIRAANILFGKGQSWKDVAKKMNDFYLENLKTI